MHERNSGVGAGVRRKTANVGAELVRSRRDVMSRQTLVHGMRSGVPLAFGALLFLASVALIVLFAAALLLVTMFVV
jgi:hypothetical protein